MDIYECERRAIDDGASDSATFDVVGPNGTIPVKWLDAHMGIMKGDGQPGFWTTRDVAQQASALGLRIENYQPNV